MNHFHVFRSLAALAFLAVITLSVRLGPLKWWEALWIGVPLLVVYVIVSIAMEGWENER